MEPNAMLRWVECHPASAVWMQAILTIAALGIAIAVPIYAQRLASKSEDRRILGVVAGILANAAVLLKRAADEFETELRAENYLSSEFDPDIWETIIGALGSIRLDRLPGFVSSRGVIGATETMQRAYAHMCEMRKELKEQHSMAGYGIVAADLKVFLESLRGVSIVIDQCVKDGRDIGPKE